ncbi:S-adenosyl-L-methionine-dependent methyltransferase [Leucogyrophana mollusca]|uniref:S-adenosyl-L-methionine-dependent methyltransferase n=1 Tax=Leucogyrophana mollusca TaxID=85980 RepID=A0ACB8B550_9AGAM|nr:S-adenosyl-L-methionine-dependent methyltransferase [Leucogyrophana mollusca]
MALPQDNKEYGTKEYWDTRYALEPSDATFDWFKSYADLKPHVRELVPDKAARILILGCGNSKFSEEMYDDGYKNIVNVDYSSVVIRQMQERHASTRPEMQWKEMDVRDMSLFDDASFDVAIDKGTMDAMMTSSSDVWNPPEQVVQDCIAEVKEVLRVLRKPSGLFLYITFGQPHFRRRYLSFPNTVLRVKELGEMFHYYMYIVTS